MLLPLIGLRWLFCQAVYSIEACKSDRRMDIRAGVSFPLSEDHSLHIKPIVEKADKGPEAKWSPKDEKAWSAIITLFK